MIDIKRSLIIGLKVSLILLPLNIVFYIFGDWLLDLPGFFILNVLIYITLAFFFIGLILNKFHDWIFKEKEKK